MVIRNDLAMVKMRLQDKWYEIVCGKPKIERKQGTNQRYACNSRIPYETNPGDEEWSIEIPEIAQSQRKRFELIMDRQSSGKMKHPPELTVYKYTIEGKLVKDYHLKGVFIESISQEANDAFDAKGSAMDKVDTTIQKDRNETDVTTEGPKGAVSSTDSAVLSMAQSRT